MYQNPVDLEYYPKHCKREIEYLAKDQIGELRHGTKQLPGRTQGQAKVGGRRLSAASALGALLSFIVGQ